MPPATADVSSDTYLKEASTSHADTSWLEAMCSRSLKPFLVVDLGRIKRVDSEKVLPGAGIAPPTAPGACRVKKPCLSSLTSKQWPQASFARFRAEMG